MFTVLAQNESLAQSRTRMVFAALAEDIGTGDPTAQLSPDKPAHAQLMLKDEWGVLCGQDWFNECVWALAPEATIQWHAKEGEEIHRGQMLVSINAPARALLSAERSAINFLQTLSATATKTRRFTQAIKGASPNPRGCLILDTRKTLPGLRLAQKYAVMIGGGANQRIALWDGLLIKENHIIACGGIMPALAHAKKIVDDWHAKTGQNLSVQIEVESLLELSQAINAGAKSVLIDDFSLQQMRDAVAMAQDHAQQTNTAPILIEASGGANLDNVRAIAQTGVDRISVGELTKSINAVDFSWRLMD